MKSRRSNKKWSNSMVTLAINWSECRRHVIDHAGEHIKDLGVAALHAHRSSLGLGEAKEGRWLSLNPRAHDQVSDSYWSHLGRDLKRSPR
jgi:hypothetical protein